MFNALFNLNIKTNSVDYCDGVQHVAICKFWNCAKNILYTSMLRKLVKEYLLLPFKV